ncbi:MAG: peptide deformylase [Deltaproteobacteria bacterium]|jgi:peptide deformylase|nr:peptide deformylase [Deltaproteobacteria bacterium]
MSLLPILKFPDPKLRQVSKPVTVFDENLASLAKDMKETMLAAPGAGLAAPQIDKFIRLVVIDASLEDEEYGSRVLTLINPEIISEEGNIIYNEGCLSIEDLQSKVARANKVKVKALDLEGRGFVFTGEGRQAVVLQHEIDHLNGILFIDHLSRLKRDMYIKRLQKLQSHSQSQG